MELCTGLVGLVPARPSRSPVDCGLCFPKIPPIKLDTRRSMHFMRVPRGGAKELIAHLRQHRPAVNEAKAKIGEARSWACARSMSDHWRLRDDRARALGGSDQGAYNRSTVGTLVERTSRYVLLVKIDGTDAHVALECFTGSCAMCRAVCGQTLTYDQGKKWPNIRSFPSACRLMCALPTRTAPGSAAAMKTSMG